MRSYLFASSRNPNITYTTTVHDNGAVTCSCPARVECWHVKTVKTRPIVGRSKDTPISRDDRYALLRLLREGNTDGARALALSLFPSMSVEETDELLQELLDHAAEQEELYEDVYGDIADALFARERDTE